MSSGGGPMKPPKPPQMPAIPPPVPAPAPPPPEAATGEADKRMKAILAAKGRDSTILTNPANLGAPVVGKPQLGV
jgi:hypothetical protein